MGLALESLGARMKQGKTCFITLFREGMRSWKWFHKCIFTMSSQCRLAYAFHHISISLFFFSNHDNIKFRNRTLVVSLCFCLAYQVPPGAENICTQAWPVSDMFTYTGLLRVPFNNAISSCFVGMSREVTCLSIATSALAPRLKFLGKETRKTFWNIFQSSDMIYICVRIDDTNLMSCYCFFGGPYYSLYAQNSYRNLEKRSIFLKLKAKKDKQFSILALK